MQTLLDRLERGAVFVGGLALVAMMLHVSFDVIGKFVFNTPLPLTMEMATYYYMTAVVFLPLAALERHGSSLVHVELFYDRLSRRARTVVLPLALSLAAVYCACAGWAAWKPALRAMRSGTYAGSELIVSIWPTRFLPVVGFALLALALLLKTVLILRRGLEAVDRPEDLLETIHEEG
ncbi:TRAP transporter small permease [Castellaniella sp. WN]